MINTTILNTLTPESLVDQIKKLNTPLVLVSVLLLLGLAVVVTGYHSIQNIFFPVKLTTMQTAYHPLRQVNAQALETYHLLGAAPASAVNHIPLSKLGYTVNAILLNNKGVGQALIAVKGKSRLAQVNTTLAPGVTVHAITATTVIVSNHGRLGKLQMIAPLDFSTQKPPRTLFTNNNVKVIR